MPEIQLKQPGFTSSACQPFARKKEIVKKLKETGYWKCSYQNELDTAHFHENMV